MDVEKSVSYDPAEGDNRPMFNSPKLSDVRFLVEGEIVYGHKLILAMGSPVFESMFFGELKEQREVIEDKDLTLVGFKNALRYIYGFPIDYELCDLCESYMAADKYLLHSFGKAFSDYVKSKLNLKNSYLIYDQLVKIGEREEIPLVSVRDVLSNNSWVIFESEHFTQTDQGTLISLLSLDELSIDELDLLVAVSKWVECEVQRQGLPVNRENQRKVFEPIKGYVLFSALKLSKAPKCKVIAELLTREEARSLRLHLRQGEPLMIEQKTSRRATMCSVFVRDLFSPGQGVYSLGSVGLTSNRRVSIKIIYLTYSQSTNRSFQVRKGDALLLWDLKAERSVKDGKLRLSLSPPLEVEANEEYSLIVFDIGTLKSED